MERSEQARSKLAPPHRQGGVSRREFIQSLGVTAAAGSLAHVADARAPEADQPDVIGPGPAPVTLNINGKPMRAQLEPSTTLLDALRLHLNLTGSKEVCDRGACGACSVLIDGECRSKR